MSEENGSRAGQRQGQVRPGGLDPVVIDPKVVPQANRRRFTAEYKMRVLREVDGCSASGQVGALLRREGLYSSHLTKWRQQREAGALGALAPQKRGRKPNPATVIAELEREKAQLTARLEQAELIIDAQKKLCAIFASATTGAMTAQGSR